MPMSDVFTPAKRSWLMARVRTRDTRPEVVLRQALWRKGVRGWRLRSRLPGRPDVAFPRAKIAVFVDGAFWHGHPSKFRFGSSGPFWDAKIAANIARDRRTARQLRAIGWSVLRCWDFDVLRRSDQVALRIARRLERGLLHSAAVRRVASA